MSINIARLTWLLSTKIDINKLDQFSICNPVCSWVSTALTSSGLKTGSNFSTVKSSGDMQRFLNQHECNEEINEWKVKTNQPQ